ncbi:hypothetical protein [Clostridium felsineum]|uniref:Uncharacterized protein n=1 Tax=Clostridium felsineum TaxID=36839 RepID=A0A1S8L010_9CLOT|nr:hypothetical protein [Clostridium felsineum]URZ06488.1 hypothetical protein CLROS_018210 [Clostridium felsineum]URZ11523.1 hypothetical protein CROST_022400 [Clostridium felsineum]
MIALSVVLEPTGVPVRHLSYSGKETTYITYSFYNTHGGAYAENREIATVYHLQVDIWTKDTFEDLADQVRTLMIDAGYYRRDEKEFYESEVQIKHYMFDFEYAESSQEN